MPAPRSPSILRLLQLHTQSSRMSSVGAGFKMAAMVFVGVALFYLTRLMLQWVGI